MRNINNILTGIVGAAALSLALTACSDSWNDHYASSDSQGAGTESLLECIQQNPQLSDFLKLCQATHLYNNMRITSVTYADLLAGDQSLTVWAPVNGSFDMNGMMRLINENEKGDSLVAQHFVTNHIARNLYNMNSRTSESVKMLNDKFVSLSADKLSSSAVIAGSYNLPANNGLLHVINSDVPYVYNVYEGLTSLSEYSHIGGFLKRFEQQKLDEDKSIQSGLVDGKKIYSDSVMYTDNVLFRRLGDVINEDSTFIMLAPSADVWAEVEQEAEKYFNYGSIEKADSVSSYWKNVSLVQDLIFNSNKAVNHSPVDSLISTSYTPREWPYHVYYKPNSANGLFDRAQIIDSLTCSNGVIYNISQWPFDTRELYFHKIVTEGEITAGLVDNKDCTYNVRSVKGDSISGGSYLDIVPAKTTSNWTATFEVRNTLSGTYDICLVTLPKTIYQANSKDKKPNKFVAKLHYVDENGEMKVHEFKDEVTNSGTNIDTVKIGTFTFPVCNYGQNDATVRLEIDCSVTVRQTSYSREMYLDCILFKPVIENEDEALEARKRKEAGK